MAELLAPGGSFEGMKMAINAGADAVYIGGSMFGARAYADNPDKEGLLEAIDFCHLHGKRLYLTVNTLMKQAEIEGLLYHYIEPLYRQGLDAVLVQDIGALGFLHREFPKLDLHISTQLSVSSVAEAKFFRDLGAVRVVPSRELSLKELSRIRNEAGVEVETFVHGALCYCYSGRCLMSSLIGGRSGNRGRCAQPCRLPYELYHNEKCVSEQEKPYLLSLKDMCALEALPLLMDAGIDSFKIEGRMKAGSYAAGVSMIYRKYMDLYKSCGREGYRIDKEDERMLMDLYNRGGFSKGFLFVHNSPDMMSPARPNHAGTAALKTGKIQNGMMTVTALEDLGTGDVIDLPGAKGQRRELTITSPLRAGERTKLPFRGSLKTGTVLPRMRNQSLNDRLNETYGKERQVPVCGWFGEKDGAACLEVCLRENQRIRASVRGVEFAPAKNNPATDESIRRQLKKTGGSEFIFTDLQINVPASSFIPVSVLNELRRSALLKLKEEMLRSYRRTNDGDGTAEDRDAAEEAGHVWKAEPAAEGSSARLKAEDAGCTPEHGRGMVLPHPRSGAGHPSLAVSVRTGEQLKSALLCAGAERIDLDCLGVPGREAVRFEEDVRRIHEAGKKAMLILPPIWRAQCEKNFFDSFSKELLGEFDGFILRSFGQIRIMQELFPGKELISDADIYIWNREAKAQAERCGITRFTVPAELNASEISEMGAGGCEILVRDRTRLMITASCLAKNSGRCTGRSSFYELKDRKNMRFPVITQCRYCFNEIFNSVPTDLTGCLKEVCALGPEALRVIFILEDKDECAKILSGLENKILRPEGAGKSSNPPGTTRGHFHRGVE